MDWQFFSVSLPFLALSERTAGIRRTVDTPFLSIAVAQLRQRPICSAISHASKGDFGTKRPISSSFQRQQRGELPFCTLCCISLSCVHAPVIGVCRRQSAALRALAPPRTLQVEVQTALLGAQRRPLLSLRTPFPFAPLRPRACGAFRLSYFPNFHVQTSFPRPAAQCGCSGSHHFTRRRTSTRRHTASAHHRSRHRAPHFGCSGAPQRTPLAL